MKQQDVAALILIVGISAIVSFFVSSRFITPSNEKKEAETVSAISNTFVLPDDKYFSDESFNPTVRIDIAPTNNPNPFVDEGQ